MPPHAPLGMTRTRYTDPSGYDDAHRLDCRRPAAHRRRGRCACRRSRASSRTPRATLPVAGTVREHRQLLGHDGFVGVRPARPRRRGLFRLPCDPLDRRQADDDHRRRVGPARLRPGRGGPRGRRPEIVAPHLRSGGVGGFTADPRTGLPRVAPARRPECTLGSVPYRRDRRTRAATMMSALRLPAGLSMIAALAVSPARCGGTAPHPAAPARALAGGTPGERHRSRQSREVLRMYARQRDRHVPGPGHIGGADHRCGGERVIGGHELGRVCTCPQRAAGIWSHPDSRAPERRPAERPAALEFARCVRRQRRSGLP